MSTLNQLKNLCGAFLADRGFARVGGDANMTVFLNQAVKYAFDKMVESGASELATVVAGTYTANARSVALATVAASLTGVDQIRQIEERTGIASTDDGYILPGMTIDQLMEYSWPEYAQHRGRPGAAYGWAQDGTSLYIHPVPTSALTLALTVIKTPTEMTIGSSDSGLPAHADTFIALHACNLGLAAVMSPNQSLIDMASIHLETLARRQAGIPFGGVARIQPS